jgi:hypothetical protein
MMDIKYVTHFRVKKIRILPTKYIYVFRVILRISKSQRLKQH